MPFEITKDNHYELHNKTFVNNSKRADETHILNSKWPTQ